MFDRFLDAFEQLLALLELGVIPLWHWRDERGVHQGVQDLFADSALAQHEHKRATFKDGRHCPARAGSGFALVVLFGCLQAQASQPFAWKQKLLRMDALN